MDPHGSGWHSVGTRLMSRFSGISHRVYTQVTLGISPSGRASGTMIAKKNKMVMIIVMIGDGNNHPVKGGNDGGSQTNDDTLPFISMAL